MQVYELARETEQFNMVLFMDVFYHLRYPTLGLNIVARLMRRMLVFQRLTMPGMEVYPDVNGLDIENRQPMLEAGWPKMAFIEAELAGDPTNW